MAHKSHTRVVQNWAYWGGWNGASDGGSQGPSLEVHFRPKVKSVWHLTRMQSLSAKETLGEFGALLADGV